ESSRHSTPLLVPRPPLRDVQQSALKSQGGPSSGRMRRFPIGELALWLSEPNSASVQIRKCSQKPILEKLLDPSTGYNLPLGSVPETRAPSPSPRPGRAARSCQEPAASLGQGAP